MNERETVLNERGAVLNERGAVINKMGVVINSMGAAVMWSDLKPGEIEKMSFDIIRRELEYADRKGSAGTTKLLERETWVLWRVIHATADFEYAKNLLFLNNPCDAAIISLKQGAAIITDTNMALSGISKHMIERYGNIALCLTSDESVTKKAAKLGVTRAAVAIEEAVSRYPSGIYVIGNSPTALLRLCELIDEHKARPSLVVGCPVGFVNVIESKEAIIKRNAPQIVTMGRKGGSNVAAAIMNAIMYGKEASGIG